MEITEDRILKFYRFLYEKNYDGSLCYYEGKFQAFINFKIDGKVLCSGEGKTPIDALNNLRDSLNKIGFL